MRAVFVLLIAASALVTGCTGAPPTQSGTGCADATIGAIWSSESSATRILLYDATGREVGKVDVAVKGLVPNTGFVPRGDKFIGVANGDAKHSETHIVEFDPATCRVSLRRIPEPVVNAVAVNDDAVYTTNTLNAEAHFTRHANDGSEQAVKYPGETGTQVALWGDALLAVTTSDGAKGRLRALDAADLGERWSLDLPVALDLGPDALVVGSKLYLPVPIDAVAEKPQDLILVVDLDRRSVTRLQVGAVSPYRIRPAGDGLVVAHTFMNPGFQPIHTYRTVSIVGAGGRATQHQAGLGITQIEVGGANLYLYGEPAEGAQRFEVRRLADFGLETQFELSAPGDMGHVYPAGFVSLRRS